MTTGREWTVGLISAVAWGTLIYFVGRWLVLTVALTDAALADQSGYPATAEAASAKTWVALRPVASALAVALTVTGAMLAWLPGLRWTHRQRCLPPMVGNWQKVCGLGSAGLFSISLILIGLLHILQPELKPGLHYLSEYAIGPFGYLMTTALLAAGFGDILLAIALAGCVTRSFWLVLACIGCSVAGLGYVALAACPIDPIGSQGPSSTPSILHDIIGGRAALAALAAVVSMAGAFWECPRWRVFATVAATVAIAMIAVKYSPVGSGGIGQRMWIFISVAFSIMVALRIGLLNNPKLNRGDG